MTSTSYSAVATVKRTPNLSVISQCARDFIGWDPGKHCVGVLLAQFDARPDEFLIEIQVADQIPAAWAVTLKRVCHQA